MAKTPLQTSKDYLAEDNKNDYLKVEYLQPTTGTPSAGQFHSGITNRAPMVDLTQDLGVRMGNKRILTHDLIEISGESVSTGRRVFGVANDKFDQIRFVGHWKSGDYSDNVGAAIENSQLADAPDTYVEVTFYGTGLNLLTRTRTGVVDFDYDVDNGASTGTISIGGSSQILGGYNYEPNIVLKVVSGLTLGLHTVKIMGKVGNTQLAFFHGFEIMNDRTDLLINKGSYYKDGKAFTLSSQQNTPYNSGFTNEYGTSGTKGGNVLVYLGEDGVVRKDVQWTDTALYLTNTDHSNEEIAARYYWQEFGSGRSTDLSTLTTASSDRAFTLGDGTTTLVAEDCFNSEQNETQFLQPNGAADWYTFIFTGTGLDIEGEYANTVNDVTVEIDGVNVGTMAQSLDVNARIYRVASGLPYGTHTVKITRVSTSYLRALSFIVYQPKEPALPADSVKLASYNLMADYSYVPRIGELNKISQGTLLKSPQRELQYSGTIWAEAGPFTTSYLTGMRLNAADDGDAAIEYTFFGTGIEHVLGNNNGSAYNHVYSIDGNPDLSGYTVVTQLETGLSFNDATGNLTGTPPGFDNSQTISISGLPLGWHTFRIEKIGVNTGPMYVDYLAVICPIHVHARNTSFTSQNTLRVGNQSIKDYRRLANQDDEMSLQIVGYANTSTTSATLLPVPFYSGSFYVDEDGMVDLEMYINNTINTSGHIAYFQINIDGEWLVRAGRQGSGTNEEDIVSMSFAKYLHKGDHHIQIYFASVNSGTITVTQGGNGDSYIKVKKRAK